MNLIEICMTNNQHIIKYVIYIYYVYIYSVYIYM